MTIDDSNISEIHHIDHLKESIRVEYVFIFQLSIDCLSYWSKYSKIITSTVVKEHSWGVGDLCLCIVAIRNDTHVFNHNQLSVQQLLPWIKAT